MKFLKILFVASVIYGIIYLIFTIKREYWRKISDRIEKCPDRGIAAIIMSLSIIPELYSAFNKVLPMAADEVCTIANAAFFAGYDWSSYMSQKMYYNFGYTMLLVPVYKIFSDPVVIYRVMLVITALLHSLTTLVAYIVLRKYFSTSKRMSGAIALVSTCNTLGLFFDSFVYNELPLAMVMWLTLLILLELVNAKGIKKLMLSSLLAFVVAYSYILHSRCLILFVTLGMVFLLYMFIYRKLIFEPISFAVIFSGCIMAGEKMVQYVQTTLYLKGTDEEMKNSVSYVASKTGRNAVNGWDSIKRIFGHFISLSGALTIETAGVMTLITVVALYYVVKNFKRYIKGEERPELFLLTAYSFISLWGMVACISLLGANKFYFLIYTRYFDPFLGPFILLGLLLMKKAKKIRFSWSLIWTGVITVVVCAVYMFYTLPLLMKQSMSKRTSLFFFLPFARYEKQGRFSFNVIAIALFVLVVYTCVILFLYYRRQMVALCAVVLMFSVVLFVRMEEKKCIPSSAKRFRMGNATYELMNSGQVDDKEVYCVGSDLFRKAVLVLNYDDDIEYRMSKFEESESAVLVTNSVDYLEKYNAPHIYRMDGNEYVGVWDDGLNKEFEGIYQAVTP